MSIDYSTPLTIEASLQTRSRREAANLSILAGRPGSFARRPQASEWLPKQFKKSEKTEPQRKRDHVGEICKVTIHPTAEEEIFYSAVRAALAQDGEDLLMT